MCLTDFAMESKIEIIQINISGEDKPGMTSSLTDILARYDAFILDIGQANIHQSLTLGILFMTTSDKSGAILKELLFKASELGVMIRFTPSPRNITRPGSVVRQEPLYYHSFGTSGYGAPYRRGHQSGRRTGTQHRRDQATYGPYAARGGEPCHPRLHRAFGARYARR